MQRISIPARRSNNHAQKPQPQTHQFPMENGDATLASPAAAAENAVPNGGVAEADQPPVTHAVKSYAAAADNSAPNGGVAEDEQGPVTHATKSYAAVAAHAEIEDLRAAKLDLQERLAEARRENKAIAAETHRIEGTFMQAREEVIIAEDAAVSAEKEAASLRAEVERLQHLLEIEKGEHEMDKRRHKELAKEVEAVRQEKLKLEEEIKALKASAAAATAKEREAAPAAEAPKEVEVAWQGMAAAAAAGAAATAAVVLIYLRLKR
ncbi:uncharacterized protein LOC133918661 [Phragmites australis]|uniref:uncharacterized protein LOC133918661 n=1 Tax=Phragmites australis TaxID=29695 RepID=UPI002D79826E|nr:uncharacterized protein LOC133918661 [Phragmites australis]